MFLSSISQWFTSRCQPSKPSRRPAVRLGLERLETREVPAFFGGLPFELPTPAPPLVSPAFAAPVNQAASFNQQILNFCNQHLHSKVGGGECSHLVSEALRVAGADFQAHNPGNGDYIWGTLINTYTHGHATSSAHCQPGDILQFQNVTLSNGGTYPQHTAIVAAVDNSGRPTMVYEQNVGVNGKGKGSGVHDRTDRLDTYSVNPNTILSGTVHVYRAVPRQDSPGTVQFSVVNDTTHNQTVMIYFNGVSQKTISLTSFNTLASYEPASFWNSGRGSWSIGINGKKVTLTNAGGYEVYTASNGQTSIRAI
jgi:hypothetical protein